MIFTLRIRHILIFFFLLFTVFFSFSDLLWGSPFFFHPDERNIVYSLTQLSLPTQMNPHFFAYGSFPIYFTFFTGLTLRFFQTNHLSFDEALFSLRILSALLNCAIFLSLLIIGKRLWNSLVGTFSCILWALSVGALQYAHFGTFEMWQVFLLLWFFWGGIQSLKNPSSFKTLIVWSIVSGLLLGTKISYLPFFALPMLSFLIVTIKRKNVFFLWRVILSVIVGAVVFLITNPFVFLDQSEFLNSFHYESSVALGTLPVFYTQAFLQTVPVAYQFLHVFPFLMNPLVFLFSLFSEGFIAFLAWKKKDPLLTLLLVMTLLVFGNTALLFVKWTRYMVPVLPFLYLTCGISLFFLWKEKNRIIPLILTLLLFFSAFLSSFSYIKTVLYSPDTRMAAAQWALTRMPYASTVVSEPYDLGILPFNPLFNHLELAPLYDADHDRQAFDQTLGLFGRADAVILPSQRILQSRLASPSLFPKTATLYHDLFNPSQFRLIYQTPCDVFCQILYTPDPLWYEQTASVFDHPFIFIFQKIKS